MDVLPDGGWNCEAAASSKASLAFPTWWHYDILRGLDYLRSAGVVPDARVADAVGIVRSKRAADGRWALDVSCSGVMPVELDEREGECSRWITLRAMRVLHWSDGV